MKKMTVLDAVLVLTREGVLSHTMADFCHRVDGTKRRQAEFLCEDDGNYIIRAQNGVEKLPKAQFLREY